MKRLCSYMVLFAFGLLIATPTEAQNKKDGKVKAVKASHKSDRVIETVNGCDYDVISGLAEVVRIEKVVNADESPLKYDEYEVGFIFHAYEGGPLMASIKDTELPFMLRHQMHEMRVGPEYLKAYYVRKGTKYAMKLLQDRNGCSDKEYRLDSRGLPNDLFEARPNLKTFQRNAFNAKLLAKEGQILEDGIGGTYDPRDETPVEEENTNVRPEGTNPVENGHRTIDENPPVIDRDPEEETTTTEENTDPVNEETTPADEIPLSNEEALRKQLKEEIRAKLEAERLKKHMEEEEAFRKAEELKRKNAIKDARKKSKAEEEERKKQEELDRIEEEKRKRLEEEARERLAKQIEEELRKEMLENERKKQADLIEAEKRKAEEKRKLEEEAAKLEEAKRAKEQEKERANCSYSNKISGTIEILETQKSLEASQSLLGYTEYEVLVRFYPDNFNDLAKKDRKVWEEAYEFKIDPKGKSANPSARYVRQYIIPKGLKGAKYKGFAQLLQGGVCTQVMFFSPDLPADVSQVR